MKLNHLYILFLIFPTYLSAQSEIDKTTYLDSTFKKTDKENHVYYRIVKDYYREQENYQIEEYYKSGHLKMSGVSVDNINFKYFGLVTRYFENNTVASKTLYKDGQPNGPYFSWYPDGTKEVEGEFISDKFSEHKEVVLKINQFWDESGIQKVKDNNGIYNEVYPKFFATGAIKNGLKNGTWSGTDKQFKISFSENYADGKFISGISTDENARKYTYTEIHQRPSPKKGVQHFYNFVGKKFKIRDEANGRIILSFIVDKNGEIGEIEILKGINSKLDNEAIRVVNSYNDWQPGKMRGVNVRVLYSLPITIAQE